MATEPETLATDVLVVGTGIAGCAAALAAAEYDVDVLLVEKRDDEDFGGNASLSGGGFRVERPDEFYRTLLEYSSRKADNRLARIVADETRDTVRWLKSYGVRFDWNEDQSIARAVGRGRSLANDLRAALEGTDVRIEFETKAERLLIEGRNAVAGLEVSRRTDRTNVLADYGTIIATGGFGANEEMVVKYLGPDATDIVNRGHAHVTGDGHRMMRARGAMLRNMGDCHGSPIDPVSKANFIGWYRHGLLVDRNGDRFVDEGEATYVEIGKAIFSRPGQVAYGILGDDWREVVPAERREYFLENGGTLIRATSIDELAAVGDIPLDALVRTIETYDDAVRNGTGDELSPARSGCAQPLGGPPYFVTPLVNGSALTFGGVTVTHEARVVDLEGEPIPNLFAAGEVVGGLFYGNYPSGASLSSGAVVGRIAGEVAATNGS